MSDADEALYGTRPRCPICKGEPEPGQLVPKVSLFRCGRCGAAHTPAEWGWVRTATEMQGHVHGSITIKVQSSSAPVDSHYTIHSIQPIDAIEDWSKTWTGRESFALANLVKLAARYRTKSTPQYNLKAMKFYVQVLERALQGEIDG